MINFNVQNIINDTIFLEKNEINIIRSNILPYQIYNKSLNKLEKCIRRIIINNKIYGSGFLMALEKGDSPFYCLITNEHVISEDLIENEAEIIILYTEKEKLKIKLNKKERFIRNYGYLGIDATVIQIFPDKKEIKKKFFFKNNNLEILAKNNYEILKNKNVHILQYPGSKNILSYSQGEYVEIFNLNEFFHKASTQSGSSGSPIFVFYNDKIVIFGIHRGGKEDEKKNLGEFIYPIINSLKLDALFYKSKKFKGEVIKKNDKFIQQGELIIEKENEEKKNKKEKYIYVGELLNYSPNGKGILYQSIKYKGNKKKNRVKYCGDFVQGKYQGKGILYFDYKEKSYYEGEFNDNKRHGYGKYYLKNILKYEGEFKDDEYDGNGTIYYKDGSHYEGEFNKGKRNGEGIIFDKNNSILEKGEFEDGITPINGIIRQISQRQNLNELNNIFNQLFEAGRTILNIFGIEANFICENCGCYTDDHHLVEGSKWECHKCNSECENNCFLNILK